MADEQQVTAVPAVTDTVTTTGEVSSDSAAPGVSGRNGNGQRQATVEDKAFKAGWAKAAERTRREVLGELGLDTDEALASYRAQREAAEATKPEAEKLKTSIKTERAAWETKLRTEAERTKQLERQLKEQAEINLSLVLRGEASEIARAFNAYDPEQVYEYIDARTKPIERDGDTVMMFTDGALTVDLDDAEARQKIADHLAKKRPNYFRVPVPGGAGSLGHGATVMGARATQPKSTAELAQSIVAGLTAFKRS